MQKTIVVTGSSQGIGRVLVEQFAKNGDQVIACARKGNEWSQNIPANVKFFEFDLTKRNSHFQLVEEAIKWSGKIDVYINNLGLSAWMPLQEIDEDFAKKMIETNLLSALWGSQAFAEKASKDSCLINISSLAGKRGSANNGLYCASKFAVNGLTQSLAKELGPRGIRVNAVCPVYIKTHNLLEALEDKNSPTAGGDTDQYFENFSQSQTALKRLPLAEEIASTCLFLASQAASGITGQCLNVDCGVMPQ